MQSNAAVADSATLRTGLDVRLAARSGALDAPTSGLAYGYVQGNLAILPHDHAEDSCASARPIQSRARCSACRSRAIPRSLRSPPTSTSAPTSRAIASGATAR